MMGERDARLAEAARNAIATLPLPGGGELGRSDRFAGLTVEDGRISAAIRVNAEEVETYAGLRSQAEGILRSLPGVDKALVVLTDAAETQQEEEHRTVQSAKSAVLPEVTHVVAVASGKGGVGKSTTAVNLALALRAQGLKVGILDADIYGPSLPTLLGLRGRPRVDAERRLLPMEAYGLKAMSIGVLVDEETAMIWRGPMVMSALTQMVAEVQWGKLDMLLIDMPPGTGDAQLAIAQGTNLAGAVIVTTPQDLSMVDVRRGITMFRKVDVPILGIVENMAQFICPNCGTTHAIFGQSGAQTEAARQDVPFLGSVPLTIELCHASDRGQPVTALDPDGPLGEVYRGLAARLLEEVEL